MKKLFTLFAMLTLFGICSAFADAEPKVSLLFSEDSNPWGLPTSNTTGLNSYTNGDYTIKLYAGTAYKFSGNSGKKYLLLGKKDAYLQLPTFDFEVSKIVVTGNSAGSSSTVMNMFVGGTAVSTQTTGSDGVNTYLINEDYKSPGNVYILKITSSHNAQITRIDIYEPEAIDARTPVSLSFSVDEAEYIKGETYTKPVLTSSVDGLAIKYSSSNESVATVDEETGDVTYVSHGKTTIKATFEGDASYKSASAEYELTCVNPLLVSWSASIYGDEDKEIPNDDIDEYTSWSSTEGSYSTKYYKSNNTLRVYNGGLFTISSTQVIKSLTITFSGPTKTFDTETSTPLKVNPNSNSMTWSVSRTTEIKSIEIEYADVVSLAAGNYASYSSALSATIPDGITAYRISSVEDNTAVLAVISGIIPANKGVILKNISSEEKSILLARSATAGEDVANLLAPSTDVTAVAGDYVLANDANGWGFYPLSAGGALPAGKAYLPKANVSSPLGAPMRIVFEDEATAISKTIADNKQSTAAYNLAGQKVSEDFRGIVVKNGKKVFVK